MSYVTHKAFFQTSTVFLNLLRHLSFIGLIPVGERWLKSCKCNIFLSRPTTKRLNSQIKMSVILLSSIENDFLLWKKKCSLANYTIFWYEISPWIWFLKKRREKKSYYKFSIVVHLSIVQVYLFIHGKFPLSFWTTKKLIHRFITFIFAFKVRHFWPFKLN